MMAILGFTCRISSSSLAVFQFSWSFVFLSYTFWRLLDARRLDVDLWITIAVQRTHWWERTSTLCSIDGCFVQKYDETRNYQTRVRLRVQFEIADIIRIIELCFVFRGSKRNFYFPIIRFQLSFPICIRYVKKVLIISWRKHSRFYYWKSHFYYIRAIILLSFDLWLSSGVYVSNIILPYIINNNNILIFILKI